MIKMKWRMKWPWVGGDGYRKHRRRIHQEYERRRKQLHDLCGAVKADSVSDLQDILCCMVLVDMVLHDMAESIWRLNESSSTES
ncbi:ATPase E1-E2 type family protein / haloacid dehalogenase-like hydrolase family protein [Prunus dulcis]|uniref:ATPase E1-E2 type family protein / haloacid dehalogenase-like hydrolase family protein n=1 Tax=Prunus dulcis TaxID=3755 RepID=A0A4Y1R7D7_PRUDU|nr:ATPase E1-E2 type family protein / haloacid dehalogenase-like hydrolase family protein [Prunus dulcis]